MTPRTLSCLGIPDVRLEQANNLVLQVDLLIQCCTSATLMHCRSPESGTVLQHTSSHACARAPVGTTQLLEPAGLIFALVIQLTQQLSPCSAVSLWHQGCHPVQPHHSGIKAVTLCSHITLVSRLAKCSSPAQQKQQAGAANGSQLQVRCPFRQHDRVMLRQSMD